MATKRWRKPFPIFSKLTGTIEAGYFRSARERPSASRGGSTYLRTEVGGMLTYQFHPIVTLQVGAAQGFMGNFLANATGSSGVEDSIYEVFSRLQFAL